MYFFDPSVQDKLENIVSSLTRLVHDHRQRGADYCMDRDRFLPLLGTRQLLNGRDLDAATVYTTYARSRVPGKSRAKIAQAQKSTEPLRDEIESRKRVFCHLLCVEFRYIRVIQDANMIQ